MSSLRITLLAVALAMMLASCGDGSTDDGVDGGVPILDRTPTSEYSCQITKDVTKAGVTPLNGDPALAARGASGEFLLLSTELRDKLIVSRMMSSADSEAVLFEVDAAAGDLRAPSIHVDADAIELTWVEGGSVVLARYDAQGTNVLAPIAAGPAPAFHGIGNLGQGSYRVARSDSGYGVLWATDYVQNSDTRSIRFTSFDHSGANSAAAIEIDRATTPAFLGAVNLAPADGGFIAVWSKFTAETSEIYLAKIAGDGTLVFGPTRFIELGGTSGSGFEENTLAIERVGSRWLLAWSEGEQGDWSTGTGAYVIIRVAQFDDDGNAIGAPVNLRNPVEDVDDVEPSIFWYGDALAMMWARGEHIYACGGCTPDHDIFMLLLDPDTLAPASNTIQLADPTPGGVRNQLGGLLRRNSAVSDRELLTTFTVQHHIDADYGWAKLRCAP